MSSNANDVSKMVGIYKKLFFWLAIITAVGIGIAFLHLPVWGAITIALAIIFLKSKVVIDLLKHLMLGKNVLIILFGLTAIFFVTVIILPLLNHTGPITDTVDLSKEIQAQAPPMEKKHGH